MGVGEQTPGAGMRGADDDGTQPPRFTVCIPTRNRGAGIVPTLESLRRLDHDSFEVIIADQSVDSLTERAYRDTVADDLRFSYVHSETVGRSAACNVAAARARGVNLAFTDDDCVVPSDWLSGMERALARHPGLGMIGGGIRAAAHDHTRHYTPDFTPPRSRLHRSPWLAYRAGGIGGGNLVFRARAFRELGGFDEVLGVGAPLRGGEDVDNVYRLLRRGHGVLVLPEPAVLHRELKTWDVDGRSYLRSLARAEGAVYMKHLRLGDPAVIPSMLLRPLAWVNWRNVARLRRPNGLYMVVSFIFGARASFAYRVDRSFCKYRPTKLPQTLTATAGHSTHPAR
jgi:glycosyltransferase involved in cell wall biosynthesis